MCHQKGDFFVRKKVLSLLLAFCMIVMPFTVAYADGGADNGTPKEIIYIDSSADLVRAIQNQQDNQTWIFREAGEFDAKNTAEGSNGVYEDTSFYSYGFAFPVFVDNLTIQKADSVQGDVIITSTYVAKDANWHNQNFITVYGDGLTIQDVSIQANRNTAVRDADGKPWYDNLANKAIEFTAESRDFTLRNVKLLPLTNEDGEQNSGSIWVGCNNVGSSSIINVEMASFISGGDYDGTLTVDGLTQDFTDFNRAGIETYLYGIRPTTKGTLNVSDFTILADDSVNLAEQVFSERLPAGTTVQLAPGDYNVTQDKKSRPGFYGSGAVISQDGITIEALDPSNKPVLYGFSNEFNAGVEPDGINGQDTIYVSGQDVTLENLVIMPLGGIGENANTWQKTVEVTSTATDFTMTGCETKPNDKQKGGNANSMATAAGLIHVSTNDAAISGNSFGEGTTVSAGWAEYEGNTVTKYYSVDVSGNYWGENMTAEKLAEKLDGAKANSFYMTVADMESEQNAVPVGGKLVKNSAELQTAINSAENGDTITLGANITLTGPLPGAAISGKELTIVGNNHTISFDQSQTYNAVFGNNNAPLYAGTKLTVKNVNFKNTGNQGGYTSIVGYNANGSAIKYEGCTFENLYAAVYVNPVRNAPENGVDVSITGCEYSNTQYGYAVDQISEDGIWNVVDVTFENNKGDFQENEPLRNTVIATVDGVERFYKTIQAAVDAANDGSVITVAPGTYDETVVFKGKSVKLQGANAGVNPNDPEAKRGEESVFTGTMSTSGTAFKADQTVVIDGFKFTGDGLKVGDTNWNKVGNLTVQNCVMETGGNLSANTTSGMNNASNYFVKVSGGQDNDYANVVIRDNLVTGKAVENVYPIQAWNVQTAEITGNVIRLTGAENHQAINVTKPAADAEITVSGNTIDGVGSGVYVTTATKGGADFTGIVRVSDNVLTDADEPFYIGWESEEHGNFAGMLVAGGNTNNEKPVEVTAYTKPGAPEVKCLTATFMNENGDEYGSITIPLSFDDDDDPDSVTFPLRAPEDIPDGFTFTGWKSKNTGRIYDPENVHELTIKQDTVFVAQWEETDDGDGDGDGGDKPSGGGSSSDDSSVGSPLPTVPTEPGDPTDPTDPSTPSGFVSDTTDDLTVNGTYQFRITSLDGTIPFLTVDNANFRVEFASQEGNDFFFKIHAQGAAGSTTVVSVNGVRLLTATVGGSATGVISDTTAPFTVKKGETYQFRLTASERPSFAAGSASFTVEYAGQIGSDYFYKVYAAGNVGDGCGFYINGEASPVAVATIA